MADVTSLTGVADDGVRPLGVDVQVLLQVADGDAPVQSREPLHGARGVDDHSVGGRPVRDDCHLEVHPLGTARAQWVNA